MFVEINDCATVNTDHIAWIENDGNEKSIVHLDDGTEHSVDKEAVKRALNGMYGCHTIKKG